MSLRGIMETKVGLLRHQLTIQTATVAMGGRGEPIETWGAGVTVKAAIIPLTGDELIAAQQQVAFVTHKILIQYVAGIKPRMRGIGVTAPFAGSTFEFLYAAPVSGEMVAIEILARELV